MIPDKEAKTIQWGEKTTFSTNGCGKTRYPHAKEQSVPLPYTIHKKELKMDQRSKCKTSIYKNVRRKHRIKVS